MSKKDAIQLEGLDNIGLQVNDVIKDVVTSEAQLLVDTLRSTMERLKVFASYNLVQSIESKVFKDGFEVSMDEYWKYVNEGVQGTKGGYSRAGYRYTSKKPPVSIFQQWEYFKKTYKNPYALREIVYQQGIEPRLFVDKAIDEYYKTK